MPSTMIITTLRNNTDSKVVLREGHVGVLRKVCEIPAHGSYQVRSNLTATYKEYWCAVQENNEKFILTSDDCIDWKEIEIRPKDGDPTKFEWKGRVPAKASQQGLQDPPPLDSPSAAPSSLMSKLLPKKLVGWFAKHESPGN